MRLRRRRVLELTWHLLRSPSNKVTSIKASNYIFLISTTMKEMYRIFDSLRRQKCLCVSVKLFKFTFNVSALAGFCVLGPDPKEMVSSSQHWPVPISVLDPKHFGTDPVPEFDIWALRIRFLQNLMYSTVSKNIHGAV
jgi:hypothetical protein